jgi:rod shape determining protein RodA
LDVQETRKKEYTIDAWMLGGLAILLCSGCILIYTATFEESVKYWQKQIVFVSLGIFVSAFIYLLPHKFFAMIAYPIYFLGLIPLIYVSMSQSGNVERWISLPGGLKYQPSETMKIVLMLALARYLSEHPVTMRHIKTLVMPFLMFLVPFLIVLQQPDLSTALVLAVMLLAMLFWAGLKWWEILILVSPVLSAILTSNELLWGLLFAALFLIMWLFRVHLIMMLTVLCINMAAGYSSLLVWNKILKPHQRGRILTFLDPLRDPQGAGYQIIQSKVATGSGGLWGKGFQEGTQTNLSFLPEEHTDFIFSVLGEQFGFVGCGFILCTFLFVLYRILSICTYVRSGFANLVIVGITSILFFHVVVNVAMTLGMMPVTGLPLPFISYGGTFLITCMVLIGMALNIRARAI